MNGVQTITEGHSGEGGERGNGRNSEGGEEERKGVYRGGGGFQHV